MEFKFKKLPEAKVELEIEISKEELDGFISQATLELGKDLEVQGFRKGKASKEVIEQKIGKENILVEAADLAVKENYTKAIVQLAEKEDMEAISYPKIDIIKLAPGNPFIFKAVTPVLPEIELPDYKKIAEKSERKEVSIDDKDMQAALDWLQKSRSKLTLKNAPAEKGDFVEIEYFSPLIKGMDKEGGRKDAFIIGDGHFIPGFEDKLVGMEAGGKDNEFSLTLPKEFAIKDVAGKEVDFKVKVKSVQKVELPEVNDEFAKSLGQFEKLEDLKKNIKEGLLSEKTQAETRRVRDEILGNIGKELKAGIPAILIEREQVAMMDGFKKEVTEKLDVSLKDYLEKIKKTEEEMLDSFKVEAEKRVKDFLILRGIRKKEAIEVTDDEVRDEVNKILAQHPNTDEANKNVDIERIREYSKGLIKNEKTLALLESFTKESK